MKMLNSSVIASEFMEKGFSKSCPVIDMHGHYGPLFEGYLPAATPNLMKRILEKSGTKKIVCSHHEALFVDVDEGNSKMQDAIKQHSDWLLGYWTCNPNFPNQVLEAPKIFGKLKGFVGFKFLPDYHQYPVTGENYKPILQYSNEYGLNILVHTWGQSDCDSPRMVAEIASKYPNVNFLMGHSGFGDWKTSVSVASDLSNVYLELACVCFAHDFSNQPGGSGTPVPLNSYLQVNGILEYFITNATSKKIIYGTDMPWYSPNYAIGSVLFARIDDEARHDILHRNAERLISKWLNK